MNLELCKRDTNFNELTYWQNMSHMWREHKLQNFLTWTHQWYEMEALKAHTFLGSWGTKRMHLWGLWSGEVVPSTAAEGHSHDQNWWPWTWAYWMKPKVVRLPYTYETLININFSIKIRKPSLLLLPKYIHMVTFGGPDYSTRTVTDILKNPINREYKLEISLPMYEN